ncbi:MAG: diaminopimelate epimerase [Bacteroidales bacterium]|nr:diaminopimelate epimerase [Bacteroidales bacterium]
MHGVKLSFYKYHGTGNDFILVDNREGHFEPECQLIAWLCHRRFGIGADGLILLNKAEGYDFGMQYFNADGRESTMCGNGGRCIVAFADFLSHFEKKCHFLGNDGAHTGHVISKDGNHYDIMLTMQDVKSYDQTGGDFILDTGSPHLVRLLEDVSRADVVTAGRKIRNRAEFQPDGINVNFMQQDGKQLLVRTYERGVEDETLSCGTGVTASALAFSVLSDKKQGIIPVKTRGGLLHVHFKRKDEGFTDICLEGPAIQVFQGQIELGDLSSLPED